MLLWILTNSYIVQQIKILPLLKSIKQIIKNCLYKVFKWITVMDLARLRIIWWKWFLIYRNAVINGPWGLMKDSKNKYLLKHLKEKNKCFERYLFFQSPYNPMDHLSRQYDIEDFQASSRYHYFIICRLQFIFVRVEFFKVFIV